MFGALDACEELSASGVNPGGPGDCWFAGTDSDYVEDFPVPVDAVVRMVATVADAVERPVYASGVEAVDLLYRYVGEAKIVTVGAGEFVYVFDGLCLDLVCARVGGFGSDIQVVGLEINVDCH